MVSGNQNIEFYNFSVDEIGYKAGKKGSKNKPNELFSVFDSNSLSRRGECWDNAAMESFFSSLKSERLNRRTYRSRDDVRADVFSYIEQFYNPRRRHSTLGYVSPMEYEKQAGFA